MALNFPNSPTNGQVYTDDVSGNRWTWDSANTCWKSTSTFTQTITVASTAPGSPVAGQLWWNKDYGRLLVYYTDADTSQWVDASPSDYTSQLAYNQSNTVFNQSNTVYIVANAAFGKANSAIANTSGVSTAGDLYVPTYIGIGTTSPTKLLTAGPGGTGTTTANYVRINGGSGVNSWYGMDFASNGTTKAQVYYDLNSAQLRFATSVDPAVRIDDSGNFIMGRASATATMHLNSTLNQNMLQLYSSAAGSGTPSILIQKASNDATTAQVIMQFLYNSGTLGLGQINGNGGSQAAFGSYSDIRVKENIENLPDQLDKICSLRPVEFDYIEGTGYSGHQTGFIAQEMQEVYPDVVAEGSDGMLTITGWNKTEARLVKAIQELSAKLDEANARIAALEGK